MIKQLGGKPKRGSKKGSKKGSIKKRVIRQRGGEVDPIFKEEITYSTKCDDNTLEKRADWAKNWEAPCGSTNDQSVLYYCRLKLLSLLDKPCGSTANKIQCMAGNAGQSNTQIMNVNDPKWLNAVNTLLSPDKQTELKMAIQMNNYDKVKEILNTENANKSSFGIKRFRGEPVRFRNASASLNTLYEADLFQNYNNLGQTEVDLYCDSDKASKYLEFKKKRVAMLQKFLNIDANTLTNIVKITNPKNDKEQIQVSRLYILSTELDDISKKNIIPSDINNMDNTQLDRKEQELKLQIETKINNYLTSIKRQGQGPISTTDAKSTTGNARAVNSAAIEQIRQQNADSQKVLPTLAVHTTGVRKPDYWITKGGAKKSSKKNSKKSGVKKSSKKSSKKNSKKGGAKKSSKKGSKKSKKY